MFHSFCCFKFTFTKDLIWFEKKDMQLTLNLDQSDNWCNWPIDLLSVQNITTINYDDRLCWTSLGCCIAFICFVQMGILAFMCTFLSQNYMKFCCLWNCWKKGIFQVLGHGSSWSILNFFGVPVLSNSNLFVWSTISLKLTTLEQEYGLTSCYTGILLSGT